MKLKIHCFFFFLGILNAVSQIAVGIPDGYSEILPIEGNYEYSYSQQLVYQNEIDVAGNITSISFMYQSGATTNSNQWEVYLGHTNKGSFVSATDWVDASQLTKVFDGLVSFPAPGNYLQINFSVPFAYNNTEHLVIAVKEKKTGYNGAILFAKTANNPATPGRAISFSDDGVMPDPFNPPMAYELTNYINHMMLGGLTQTCPAPENLQTTNIQGTSAAVQWTEQGTASQWTVYYGLNGFDPANSLQTTTLTVTSPNAVLTGLQPATAYEFYVRADCSSSDFSQLKGPVMFTTPCDIATLPYVMDFEGATHCLSFQTGGQGNGWLKMTGNQSGFTGIYAGYLFSPRPADAWLFTQAVELEQGKMYRLSYKYGNNSIFSTEKMKVAIGIENEISAMHTVLADHPEIMMATPNFNEVTFQVPDTDIYYVGFHAYSNANQNRLMLDDILIEEVTYDYTYQNGSWSPQDPSGVATATDNIIVIDGAATISLPLYVNNLNVMAGATLRMENTLNLHGNILADGDLIFGSDSNGKGELAAVSSTSTITGDVVVEHYMQNRRSYRMVSSAVTTSTSIRDNWQEGANSRADNPHPGYGTHITGSTIDRQNGFDATQTGNPSMFAVDVGAQQFVPIANTDNTTLNAGDAYLLYVRGDRQLKHIDSTGHSETTLRTRGQLHIGDYSQTFPSTAANQFVMFGNPYQSAVDINNVFDDAVNVNKGYYYVYDVNVGDYGGYVTITLPAGTNTLGLSVNQYLQAGQAAQFSTLTNGSATINFSEAHKAPGNYTANNAGSGMMATQMLNIQLFTEKKYNEGGSVQDGTAILFNPNHTNAVTASDAPKAFNFGENIAVDNNGNYLSIEQRELPQAGEVFSLYTSGFAHHEYVLKIESEGLDDYVMVLEDMFAGTETLLTSGINTYNFEISDALSKAHDRFRIRVVSDLLNVDEYAFEGVRLYPNPLRQTKFYIHAPSIADREVDVHIADMAGREIYKKQVTVSDQTLAVEIPEHVSAGIYLVTLTSQGETQTLRLVKE